MVGRRDFPLIWATQLCTRPCLPAWVCTVPQERGTCSSSPWRGARIRDGRPRLRREGHKLPAAGLRASLYRSSGGQRAVFAALGISGEVLADLRREYDPVIERDVGGVTALLTLSLAYGLWF